MGDCKLEIVSWASKPDKNGVGKISLGGESFWYKEGKHVVGNTYEAIVDNCLVFTDDHGYDLGDTIYFELEEEQ